VTRQAKLSYRVRGCLWCAGLRHLDSCGCPPRPASTGLAALASARQVQLTAMTSRRCHTCVEPRTVFRPSSASSERNWLP
jgi:hypothetical protein